MAKAFLFALSVVLGYDSVQLMHPLWKGEHD
jgi:hypothetical protein